MLRRLLSAAGIGGLIWLVTPSLAGDCSDDCDTTRRQGRVFEAGTSTVIYGAGSPRAVRTWCPLLIDSTGSLMNNSVVQIVNGRITGATSTFTATGFVRAVICFGTADSDQTNGAGDQIGSNNIRIFETINASDTVGELFSDGRLAYRANFAGVTHNGLEWVVCTPGEQTPIPEPDEGTQILAGPGIDGAAGSAFLGTPGAMAVSSGSFWVGNTNFDAFTGNIPRGANLWLYAGTPRDSTTADFSYLQGDAEVFANLNGVAVDTGDGRQTQPVLARVMGVNYVVFGIQDTTNGGSARPGLLVVDAFEDGNGFTDAVAIVAPTGYRFVDHQANGGGTNVFENAHFDMNSSGQLVALAESIVADPLVDFPTYQVLLYDPVFTAGRITGFSAPVLIADAGPGDTLADGLASPPINTISAISAVGINDRGNIAFTATFDTGIPDPNDPNTTFTDTAAYLYHAGTGTLHQLLLEFQTLTYDNNGSPIELTLGLIAQEGSDAFMAKSLANTADVMAVNFRSNDSPSVPGGSRGVAVLAIGHLGDLNFDGVSNLADLALFLSVFGRSFGQAGYDPQADLDLDGVIGLGDLAILLSQFGQPQ